MPLLFIKFLPWGILAGIIALFGAYQYGHHKGWTERDTELQIVIAERNDKARKTEQDLNAVINEKDSQLKKANDDIEKKRIAMRDLARSGGLRLPATQCTVPVGPDTPVITEPVRADASESELETINALIDIVAEGDRGITKYNQCIQLYNEVREKINASNAEPAK